MGQTGKCVNCESMIHETARSDTQSLFPRTWWNGCQGIVILHSFFETLLCDFKMQRTFSKSALILTRNPSGNRQFGYVWWNRTFFKASCELLVGFESWVQDWRRYLRSVQEVDRLIQWLDYTLDKVCKLVRSPRWPGSCECPILSRPERIKVCR